MMKGGLLTLVREDLSYTVVNDVTELECIVVKVRVKGDFICVANVYIPPGDTVNLDVLNTLLCSRKTIIVGDLNAKSKLWGSRQADERGLQLEEKIEANSAVVVNTGQPTYQHYSGSQSHLDVAIVTGDLGGRANWSVYNNTLGSDHSPTEVTIDETDTGNLETDNSSQTVFNLSKVDWKVFKNVCHESLCSDTVLLDDSVDAKYNRIVNAITLAVEKCIPRTHFSSSGRFNKKA